MQLLSPVVLHRGVYPIEQFLNTNGLARRLIGIDAGKLTLVDEYAQMSYLWKRVYLHQVLILILKLRA